MEWKLGMEPSDGGNACVVPELFVVIGCFGSNGDSSMASRRASLVVSSIELRGVCMFCLSWGSIVSM